MLNLLILSIITKFLSISSEFGNFIVLVSEIFPPNFFIAFFALFNSSSIFAALYDTNLPPTLINGRQYSDNVERLATALDTHKSYCSRYSASCPKSSALPCINSTFSSPNSSITSFRKLILF